MTKKKAEHESQLIELAMQFINEATAAGFYGLVFLSAAKPGAEKVEIFGNTREHQTAQLLASAIIGLPLGSHATNNIESETPRDSQAETHDDSSS